MNDEVVREIVDVYLVKCDKGILALCSEQETKSYLDMGKRKNISITTKKITTNMNRVNEIGNNLFNVKYPFNNKSDLIGFRNRVINEWMLRCDSIKKCNKNIVWARIAEKNNIPTKTPEEFSRSIMDKIEYE